jgi:serine phosphatase RsbU (regulator of sigma subunit)/pSer/pThr/pTyr-binding forkhead associated (FHA) protein
MALSEGVSFPRLQTEPVPYVLLAFGSAQTVIRLDHSPITIGRRSTSNIQIPDARISREHAAIICEGCDFFIEDQNSNLGTYLNGVRLGTRQRLARNDLIDFGDPQIAHMIFFPLAQEMSRAEEEDKSARELFSEITELQETGEAADLERLSLFLETARKLNTTHVLDEILVTLIEATLRLTKAERGFVFLCDTGGQLRLAAGLDQRGETLREDSTISHSTLTKAINSGCEFLVTDTKRSAELANQGSIISFDLRTVICIPLLRRLQEARTQVSGALYLDSRYASRGLSSVSNDLLHAIAREAAALLQNAELIQEQEQARRYEQELAIAGRIQQHLMTVQIPDSSFARVRARNIPCKEIGGDFFDVVSTRDSIAAVLADICGKGVSAALMASILQGMIYSPLEAAVPLPEIAEVANRFMCKKDLSEKYATFVIARLSRDGLLEVINCGLVSPFLVHAGTLWRLPPQNPPVGLLEGCSYRMESYELAPGDRLVLVTDGVTEARNAAREFFGDDRLREAVATNSFDEIFTRVQTFCGDAALSDDCSALELRYQG